MIVVMMVLGNKRKTQSWIYGRLQSLPYIFLILYSFFMLSSCSEKKEEAEKESPTHSVLILKNFNPINQMGFSDDFVQDNDTKNRNGVSVRLVSMSSDKSPVIIINPKKILPVDEINLFNNISDTVRIFHSNDVMMAEVNFSLLTSNTYYFRVGDTIVVDAKDII